MKKKQWGRISGGRGRRLCGGGGRGCDERSGGKTDLELLEIGLALLRTAVPVQTGARPLVGLAASCTHTHTPHVISCCYCYIWKHARTTTIDHGTSNQVKRLITGVSGGGGMVKRHFSFTLQCWLLNQIQDHGGETLMCINFL